MPLNNVVASPMLNANKDSFVFIALYLSFSLQKVCKTKENGKGENKLKNFRD